MPPVPPPSRISFWALHLGGWAALGLAMWLGVVGEAGRPVVALAHKLIFATVGAGLTLGLRPLYRRLRQRRLSVVALVAVCAACSYAVSVAWAGATTAATQAFDAAVLGEPFGPVQTWWFFGGALFFSFIVVAWSALYFGVSYDLEVRAERERALEAEGLLHQARLWALRYQLNPHLLFNALNALSTLIVEHENDRAERMVARLADFLRLTLSRGEVTEVRLADEVDFARRYLDIERVRFGDRLRVAFDVDADALGAHVPPLLLQPLVENAVRHGVLPREEGGAVRVEGRRVGTESGRLLLRVEDDGRGLAEGTTMSDGVGLANVRARLAAMYGADASLTLHRADGGGFVVQIDLPYRSGPDLAAVHSPVVTSSDGVAS
ncbi:sensor histidine kinase [Rubrivirga sp.]|uniref:sensor histidine kinase n=1 Tax=Rubrivirga sp. TaxID=1885344 RepID=UPI003C73DB41